jgi:hypothetical protein
MHADKKKAWLLLVICGRICLASGFDFPDFALSRGGLLLGNNAHRTKNVLRLTEALQTQIGIAWVPVKQEVRWGFDTTFTFRISDANGPGGGGDGMAFVVQNDGPSATGGWGGSGGFLRSDEGARGGFERGIRRMVGVYFDTYRNDWDNGDNNIRIYTVGEKPALRWPPIFVAESKRLKADLKAGKPHTARVVCTPNLLSVYFDSSPEPVAIAPVDIAGLIGGDGTAWVGFTASTGGDVQRTDILSWKFDTAPRPDVSSKGPSVDSTVKYKMGECMPGRVLCTPESAITVEKGPGEYHIYLPAHLEWGASVPNPDGLPVRVFNATGKVCWDTRFRDGTGCNGPAGNGIVPGQEGQAANGFLSAKSAAGALIVRSLNGRVWFSVNGRTGEGFRDNEGFFELDVRIGN